MFMNCSSVFQAHSRHLIRICWMNEKWSEDSDHPFQGAPWPNSRKLAVSWPASCDLGKIEQTWEDKWFIHHKNCIINSISKTNGLFSKFSFSIHAFSRDVVSIHCVHVRLLVFALDTLNVRAKNIKRKSLGNESRMFFLLLYFLFVCLFTYQMLYIDYILLWSEIVL